MEDSLAKKTLNVLEGDISLLNENVELTSQIQVKELPSEFKGYPEGTKIYFKPLTLEELEALNSDEMSPERAVALLLNAIKCTTLVSHDLYYWDVMYIGIQRKLLAFGNTKGTIYRRCSKCGNILSKTFEYTEIEFKQMEAPALPMKLEVCGKKLEFGELTMKDFLQIDAEQGALGVYARMIKNMEFEEAFDLVKNATGTDIKKLRFVDKQLDYGMKPFHVKCENIVNKKPCDNDMVMEVQSPFEVVFPEDEVDGYNEFEVQYG